MERRELLTILVGAAAVPLLGACERATAATEQRRQYRIGYSGFPWQNDVEEGIATIGRFGFHGIEPFRTHLLPYVDRPEAMKKLLDEAGIALVTCSNGGQGMSTNFIDRDRVGQTIEDHFVFARDFIDHFGCTHFKINLGSRPPEGPTDAQLVTMAETLNEIGRRTADLGIRLAPHPHIWAPLERPEEIARIVELTDPNYVSFTVDTAHYRLGGSDPEQFIREHFDRVAALHFKDTPLKYRDHTGATPTREEHQENNLYPPMGAGGIDFVSIVDLLDERGFNGWITLDYDPPRPIEGTIDQQLTHNKFYTERFLGMPV
jgi:inosose dehydratase